jgi:hypothetical protein
MLSTTFKSRLVGHILRRIIQGGGITLISHGSKINSPQIKEELHILQIIILQDFLLLTKIMDTLGSASVIIILSSPHSSPSFINSVTGRDHERIYENDRLINQ